MRRFLIGLAVAQILVVVAAYGAGWAASSGPAIRPGRTHGLHKWVGWGGILLAPAVPALGWAGARRLTNSGDPAAVGRTRGKMATLAAGATLLATATAALGLLAEQRGWTAYWHLGAASALLSYAVGAGLVIAGGVRR